MKGEQVVVGVFSFLDDALKSIEEVKQRGLDYRVYAPTIRHELEEATFPEKSSIRKFTLIGGILGLTFGWSLAILCSLDWPLRVSAKDIVSLPGFFVIGFECTILFAALATLLGLMHFCRIPDVLRKVGYDPRFSEDKFGLVVGCSKEEVDELSASLKSSGADEVNVKGPL